MNQANFAPGFRLSWLDVVVLVVGTVAAGTFLLVETWAAFVIAFVVGHFFLFCNVFRISRKLELAWGGVFTSLAAATMIAGSPSWVVTAVTTLVATAIVVFLEMQKPSYHGVLWQRINPGLREWWEEKAAAGGK